MNIHAPDGIAVMRTCRLGDVLDFRNEIVHPQDKPVGTATFVGLEHIQPHTGRRVGELTIDLSEMTGRRAHFYKGDIVYGYLRPYLNKVWVAEFDGLCSVDQYVFVIRSGVDRDYIAHFLRSDEFLKTAPIGLSPGQLPRIRSGEITGTPVRLPPLDEQRRIAAILDKADALRRKRKRALDLLDALTQSIFLEMFGDPAINPKGYCLRTFGEIAEKISDGPFGSNLKSEHYVESGVRIIRLQNIGAGEFIDNDQAFIAQEHADALVKHVCLPGDVLIGTLGDPNLRACLQPAWLDCAINKADCVQLRPRNDLTLPEYVAALINQPSTEKLAHGLMLGQTRTRVSMGRLRDLSVPIAPLADQVSFVSAVRAVQIRRDEVLRQTGLYNKLFASLQHRAFSGQL